MEILQKPISEKHLNAMFFNGVIAEIKKDDKHYTLQTYQTGEILYRGKYITNIEIIDLGRQGIIDDNDINHACDNNSEVFEILVDKFFAIYCNGNLINKDDSIGDGDYYESLEWFVNELHILKYLYCPRTGLLYINDVPFTKERFDLVNDVISYGLKNKFQFDYDITITNKINNSEVSINKNNIIQFLDIAIKYYKKVVSDKEFD